MIVRTYLRHPLVTFRTVSTRAGNQLFPVRSGASHTLAQPTRQQPQATWIHLRTSNFSTSQQTTAPSPPAPSVPQSFWRHTATPPPKLRCLPTYQVSKQPNHPSPKNGGFAGASSSAPAPFSSTPHLSLSRRGPLGPFPAGVRPRRPPRPVQTDCLSWPVAIMPIPLHRGLGLNVLRQPIRHPLQPQAVASAAPEPHSLVPCIAGQSQNCAQPSLVS
jgi:hypothetical protein